MLTSSAFVPRKEIGLKADAALNLRLLKHSFFSMIINTEISDKGGLVKSLF